MSKKPKSKSEDIKPPREPDTTKASDGDELFDLEELRLSQDFAAIVGVRKKIITVPVRRSHRQSFFRVHPDDPWRLETAVLNDKEDRETYLVSPEMWSELPDEIVPTVLFTTISRQGVVFLWPVRLSGKDGRHDTWSQSALEAAQLATKQWIRLVANMSLSAYAGICVGWHVSPQGIAGLMHGGKAK